MNKKVLWITTTAVFTALLIVMQAATAPLGNTLVTGSIVNLILIVSVMLCGLPTGITVAIISPVCAKLFGIGPFWTLIPFIILGNITLVLIWHLIGNRNLSSKYVSYIIALVTAAIAKFIVLFIGIVKLAIPILLKLPEPQASAISGVFSISQLFTAAIGGALAVAMLPILTKAIKSK